MSASIREFERVALGDEATVQFVSASSWGTPPKGEYHLRDGSGSCVILSLAEALALKSFLEKL